MLFHQNIAHIRHIHLYFVTILFNRSINRRLGCSFAFIFHNFSAKITICSNFLHMFTLTGYFFQISIIKLHLIFAFVKFILFSCLVGLFLNYFPYRKMCFVR